MCVRVRVRVRVCVCVRVRVCACVYYGNMLGHIQLQHMHVYNNNIIIVLTHNNISALLLSVFTDHLQCVCNYLDSIISQTMSLFLILLVCLE